MIDDGSDRLKGQHKYGNSNSQIWKNNKNTEKLHVIMRVEIQWM